MGRATHRDRTADARMGSCEGTGRKANAPDHGGLWSGASHRCRRDYGFRRLGPPPFFGVSPRASRFRPAARPPPGGAGGGGGGAGGGGPPRGGGGGLPPA